jgi:hypothetical protein
MNKNSYLISALFAGLGASACAGFARADSVVLRSNSELFISGQVLSDTDVIKLNKGIWLRLKDQATHETATLNGPYEGTISGYRGGCGVFSRFTGHCESDPGRIPIGGTRSHDR